MNSPGCSIGSQDVMGYHDAREIPNYWTYASHYVLQDHMFEPNASWSLPQHLYLVSEWSAYCATVSPQSCANALQSPGPPPDFARTKAAPNYSWTDLSYLLYKGGVSWKYYVQSGVEPDSRTDASNCPPVNQNAKTPGIWNPLPYFDTVQQDGQLGNVTDVTNYYQDARAGTLPAVTWIAPNNPTVNIHRPGSTRDRPGSQAWSTRPCRGPTGAAPRSSCRGTTGAASTTTSCPRPSTRTATASGSRHRHQPVGTEGRRRPPGAVSRWYLKFIEDVFLGGQRLDPATDGRPDPRPGVRENAPQLGNLMADFDFSQTPSPPLVLPTTPPPGPASSPP